MTPRPFGTLADGREVRAATLDWPGGLSVEVLEFGAVLRRITAPTAAGPVDAILGHDSLEACEADALYLGPVVGRCANRIGAAAFELDGEPVRVSANEGRNCLHGGATGFNKRLWRFEPPSDPDGRQITLGYVSPDGEEGFPGRVDVRASYALTAPDTLEISYEATAARATPVNLSQHLYFNLGGDLARDVLDHTLRVAASAITPVRQDLIPTGERMAVDGSPFDLRAARRIGEALAGAHPQLSIAGGFDHNWALDGQGRGADLELHSPASGLTLAIATDQPGMQIYSGQGLKPPYPRHGAIVFEPQGFPDAVNHPQFPSVIVRPGRTYRHRSTYRFRSD